jgi:hypothetical protein
MVILLNTQSFTASDWGMEELAQASAMHIRLAQLVWPGVSPIPTSDLTERRFMKASNFRGRSHGSEKSKLTDIVLETLVTEVESLRARSLAARQDNLVTTFMRRAIHVGVQASIQPYKYIKVSPGSHKKHKVVIPSVGVPQAFNYDESRNRIRQILARDRSPIYLLYDQFNVKEAWLEHLAWLDRYLPVKTVRLDRSEEWLRNL